MATVCFVKNKLLTLNQYICSKYARLSCCECFFSLVGFVPFFQVLCFLSAPLRGGIFFSLALASLLPLLPFSMPRRIQQSGIKQFEPLYVFGYGSKNPLDRAAVITSGTRGLRKGT